MGCSILYFMTVLNLLTFLIIHMNYKNHSYCRLTGEKTRTALQGEDSDSNYKEFTINEIET